MAFFSNKHFFEGKLEIKLYKEIYSFANKILWQRFEIKRHKPKSENAAIHKHKEIGLLIHRKLAEDLNL